MSHPTDSWLFRIKRWNRFLMLSSLIGCLFIPVLFLTEQQWKSNRDLAKVYQRDCRIVMAAEYEALPSSEKLNSRPADRHGIGYQVCLDDATRLERQQRHQLKSDTWEFATAIAVVPAFIGFLSVVLLVLLTLVKEFLVRDES